MSFIEQEDDVFEVVEKLMLNLFKEFSNKKIIIRKISKNSFPRGDAKIWN